MGFEFFRAFPISKLTSLQKSSAAGMAKGNEAIWIFPTNLYRLLAEITCDSIGSWQKLPLAQLTKS